MQISGDAFVGNDLADIDQGLDGRFSFTDDVGACAQAPVVPPVGGTWDSIGVTYAITAEVGYSTSLLADPTGPGTSQLDAAVPLEVFAVGEVMLPPSFDLGVSTLEPEYEFDVSGQIQLRARGVHRQHDGPLRYQGLHLALLLTEGTSARRVRTPYSFGRRRRGRRDHHRCRWHRRPQHRQRGCHQRRPTFNIFNNRSDIIVDVNGYSADHNHDDRSTRAPTEIGLVPAAFLDDVDRATDVRLNVEGIRNIFGFHIEFEPST